MDKVITTALLTLASVLVAVMALNVLLPAIGRSSTSVLSSSAASSSAIKTDIEIITVATSSAEVHLWVKNVGAVDITGIDGSDVFLEDVGTSFTRIAHEAGSPTNNCNYSPPANSWAFCYVGGETRWKPDNTIKVIIRLAAPPSGIYKVRVVTDNGVPGEKSFSV